MVSSFLKIRLLKFVMKMFKCTQNSKITKSENSKNESSKQKTANQDNKYMYIYIFLL